MDFQYDIKSFFSNNREEKECYIVVALDILGFSYYILNNYDKKDDRNDLTLLLLLRHLTVAMNITQSIVIKESFNSFFFVL